MNSESGTYTLLYRNRSKTRVQVGRLGKIDIQPGYYIYVGSAFGPGGVRARVSRHFRKTKRSHWHIDYLREFLNPYGVWYSHDNIKLEHRWACVLNNMADISAIKGFGCSDCKCFSHLFHSSTELDFTQFSKIAEAKVEIWSYKSAVHNIL